MDDIIDAIVQLEWKFFDKVQNEGGRADCQNDWQTFSVMRRSQYQAWTGPMLESWLSDLLRAYDEGRNPLTEKYGYMMQSTSPDEYAAIKDQLPVISFQKAAMVGLPALVAVGAPSSLAISLAQKVGMTLVAFARGTTFSVYAHPERLVAGPDVT